MHQLIKDLSIAGCAGEDNPYISCGLEDLRERARELLNRCD